MLAASRSLEKVVRALLADSRVDAFAVDDVRIKLRNSAVYCPFMLLLNSCSPFCTSIAYIRMEKMR
jgi:hypothetical protein